MSDRLLHPWWILQASCHPGMHHNKFGGGGGGRQPGYAPSKGLRQHKNAMAHTWDNIKLASYGGSPGMRLQRLKQHKNATAHTWDDMKLASLRRWPRYAPSKGLRQHKNAMAHTWDNMKLASLRGLGKLRIPRYAPQQIRACDNYEGAYLGHQSNPFWTVSSLSSPFHRSGTSKSPIAEARHLPCRSSASVRVTPPPSALCITKFRAPTFGIS